MNKVELIKEIATKTGFTQKDVAEVMEAATDTIKVTVASGEDVKMAGFGSFTMVERAAREGRNPSTGEALHIEASKAPKFKAATAFKDAVKNA